MKKKPSKEQLAIKVIQKYCNSVISEPHPKVYDSEWQGRHFTCSSILNILKDFEVVK